MEGLDVDERWQRISKAQIPVSLSIDARPRLMKKGLKAGASLQVINEQQISVTSFTTLLRWGEVGLGDMLRWGWGRWGERLNDWVIDAKRWRKSDISGNKFLKQRRG